MGEWRETTLGGLVELAQGVAINKKTNHVLCEKSEGLPLLKINNLVNNTVDQYANPNLVPQKAILEFDDIVFTRTGQVGWVFTQKVGILHNNSFKVIPSNKLDKKFLYWFLKQNSIYNYVQKVASGSAQPDLNHDAFKTITIRYPIEIEEQKAIANILSSFDEKIELLKEQNETLEQIAQGVFREWFVDGVDESWEDGVLSDEFKITMGQSPKGDTYNENDEGMVFYQGRAEFQNRFPKKRLCTTEPKRLAEKFDVLMSVRAPVGDINVASEQCCIGRGLSAINSEYKSYMLYKMKSLKKQFDMFESEGTVFGSINKTSLENLEVIIPPIELVEKYNLFALPIDSKIYNNTEQIQTLQKTRDTLLPKLMSGEVRVGGDCYRTD